MRDMVHCLVGHTLIVLLPAQHTVLVFETVLHGPGCQPDDRSRQQQACIENSSSACIVNIYNARLCRGKFEAQFCCNIATEVQAWLQTPTNASSVDDQVRVD